MFEIVLGMLRLQLCQQHYNTQEIDNDIVVVAGDIDKDIVVVAGDTDILVLRMFHWKEWMNIYMLAETPNKKDVDREFWKIENLVKEAEEVVKSHILFIHACSGCDTTSVIYGQGE